MGSSLTAKVVGGCPQGGAEEEEEEEEHAQQLNFLHD
jgi:hypothetical protein